MAAAARRLYANGYNELKTLVTRFGKDQRVFVLFYGARNRQGRSW